MYTVTFTDGSTFKGGEITDSKWNDMPDKQIAKISYKLDNGQTIKLEGYHAYNHIVEKSVIVTKGLYTTKLILMAKKGDDILLLIYDCQRKKLTYDTKIFGQEYNNKPCTGWKIGMKNGKPKSDIL